MKMKMLPMGDVTNDLTQASAALNQANALATTYQTGGVSAVIQPAIPYLIAYGIGIAVVTAVLTTMLMKKQRN